MSCKSRAIEWLAEQLASGPVDGVKLRKDGKALGFSSTVLYRAAEALEVTSTSVPGKFGRRTTWSLPEP